MHAPNALFASWYSLRGDSLGYFAAQKNWPSFRRLLSLNPHFASLVDKGRTRLPLEWVAAAFVVPPDDSLIDEPHGDSLMCRERMDLDDSLSNDYEEEEKSDDPWRHYRTRLAYEKDLKGRLEAVDDLLRHNPEQTTTPDARKRVALHRVVAMSTCREVAEKVLACNPEAIEIGDEDGRLPLHIAIIAGRPDQVPDKPGDDDLKEEKEDWSETPDGWERIYGSVLDVAPFLLDAFQDGAKGLDDDQRLPLHYAAAHRHDLVHKLLDAFSDGKYVTDSDGRLPLHYALAFGAPANVISALVVENRLLSRPDDHGYLPLMMPGSSPLMYQNEFQIHGKYPLRYFKHALVKFKEYIHRRRDDYTADGGHHAYIVSLSMTRKEWEMKELAFQKQIEAEQAEREAYRLEAKRKREAAEKHILEKGKAPLTSPPTPPSAGAGGVAGPSKPATSTSTVSFEFAPPPPLAEVACATSPLNDDDNNDDAAAKAKQWWLGGKGKCLSAFDRSVLDFYQYLPEVSTTPSGVKALDSFVLKCKGCHKKFYHDMTTTFNPAKYIAQHVVHCDVAQHVAHCEAVIDAVGEEAYIAFALLAASHGNSNPGKTLQKWLTKASADNGKVGTWKNILDSELAAAKK
ncbi:hypothetical protein PPROV_000612500 [Pycnococcus provasolii]|uniref:Uncharacterized protein n=1 Tax=Pycnococcus provasolii TaxID=41880 RepID=A0A830HL62_9CHLO|nr:hypothetical protein PPROV_000612500 [Pycnococcus provasolii]